MTRITIQRIDELMNQKRWDEAGKALEEFFVSDVLYNEERGRAFIMYTMAYVEAMATLNQQYRAALEQAQAVLKSINRVESEIKEDTD